LCTQVDLESSYLVLNYLIGNGWGLPPYLLPTTYLVLVTWVLAYILMISALVIALRLILKFIRQSGLSKSNQINRGMIAVHILACVLQCIGIYLWYSSTFKLLSPDLSCEQIIVLLRDTSYKITSYVICLFLAQCLTYTVCYKYATAANKNKI
jgi:hypothetical protein